MLKTVSLGLGLAVAGLAAAEDAVDLAPFLQGSPYHSAQLSPDGRHLAVTAQIADRTLLLILDRDSMQPKAKVSGSAGSAVSEFRWVSEDRVIVALAERYGLPVALADERSSSKEAARRFATRRAAGLARRKHAAAIDAVAAEVITESWLASLA